MCDPDHNILTIPLFLFKDAEMKKKTNIFQTSDFSNNPLFERDTVFPIKLS